MVHHHGAPAAGGGIRAVEAYGNGYDIVLGTGSAGLLGECGGVGAVEEAVDGVVVVVPHGEHVLMQIVVSVIPGDNLFVEVLFKGLEPYGQGILVRCHGIGGSTGGDV